MTNTVSITPIILCGGSGSRLWPLSREDLPKQFLKLNSNRSLFQETVMRMQG
ncbi:MAG: sugar phosphate nucleotidyltransferase, partial [Aestuariivirga sp.]